MRNKKQPKRKTLATVICRMSVGLYNLKQKKNDPEKNSVNQHENCRRQLTFQFSYNELIIKW